MNHPDPKLHQKISFIKSAIRILGFMVMPWDLMSSAALLILAEVVGIWEETV